MTDQIIKGFTHSGIFHADDVFATALLMLVFPGFVYYRGMQVPDDFDGIVYDIGFGEFDHHQADKEYRENGMPYASFGLLWRKYGEKFMSKDEALEFDLEFIAPIDKCDNEGGINPISTLIKEFNPTWNSKTQEDTAFEEAVEFAKGILIRHIDKYNSSLQAKYVVEEKMKSCDGKILVLDKFMPFIKYVCNTTYTHVIYKDNRGGYAVRLVPVSEKDHATKVNFPEEWFGKNGEELENISGIIGLIFCHASGFMCATNTFEAAMQVAKKYYN